MADSLDVLRLVLQSKQDIVRMLDAQIADLQRLRVEAAGQAMSLEQTIAGQDAVQAALLERIANASAEELPPMVTSFVNGEPMIWDASAGQHRPLNAIERAWKARMDAIRAAAGG